MGENHKDYHYKYTKKGKKILLRGQSKCKHSSFAPAGGIMDPHPTLGILAKVGLEEAGMHPLILLPEYPSCLIKISTVCNIL